MYACICNRVTVEQVERAVDAGADSVEAVGLATKAGTDCSCCHDHLDDIIADRCAACPFGRRVA